MTLFLFFMKKILEVPEFLLSICIQQAKFIFLSEHFICYQANIGMFSKIIQHSSLEKPDYLKSASTKRLNEFFSGRMLAQAILKKHFGCTASITSMQLKLPQWPKEILGSISHSDDQVIVIISSQSKYLGVDLERVVDSNFAEESMHLILTQSEQLLWHEGHAQPLNFREYLTLIFSLKESLYKAVYPIAQNYIDFLEVAIEEIDIKEQKVILKFNQHIQELYGLSKEYQGFWKFEEDQNIITWVSLSN
jgi:enterobactin synthetase component D